MSGAEVELCPCCGYSVIPCLTTITTGGYDIQQRIGNYVAVPAGQRATLPVPASVVVLGSSRAPAALARSRLVSLGPDMIETLPDAEEGGTGSGPARGQICGNCPPRPRHGRMAVITL